MAELLIECKVHYFEKKIVIPLYSVFFPVYVAAIIYFNPKGECSDSYLYAFIISAALGPLAAALIPLVIASVLSKCRITEEGIHEVQGYLYGLIPVVRSTPWSEVLSWDTSVAFLPMTPQRVLQIKIFFKHRFLRIDSMIKKLRCNGEKVGWDNFEIEFKSLMNRVGVQRTTPPREAAKIRFIKNLFVAFCFCVGTLIVIGSVLSLISGHFSATFFFPVVIFFMLLAGAGSRFIRKK